MPNLDFNFGNALFHFRRTGGPRGFLWKFTLSFALVTLILQAVSIWLQWPIYEIYLRILRDGGEFSRHISDLEAVEYHRAALCAYWPPQLAHVRNGEPAPLHESRGIRVAHWRR